MTDPSGFPKLSVRPKFQLIVLCCVALLPFIPLEALAVGNEATTTSPMTVTSHPSPAAVGGGIVAVSLSWNTAVDLDLEIWDARGERKLFAAFDMAGENIRSGAAGKETFQFRKYGSDDYGAGKYIVSVRIVNGTPAVLQNTRITLVVTRFDGTTELIKSAANTYPDERWHAIRIDALNGTVENIDRVFIPTFQNAAPWPPAPVPTTTPLTTAITPNQTPPPAQDLPELVRRIQPSVVLISTYDRSGMPLATGTGFFISAAGEVVTNYHVMEDADSAIITTSDGKTYDVGGIIAEDRVGDFAKLTVTFPSGAAAHVNRRFD